MVCTNPLGAGAGTCFQHYILGEYKGNSTRRRSPEPNPNTKVGFAPKAVSATRENLHELHIH